MVCENTIILKARSRNAAFKKATKIGASNSAIGGSFWAEDDKKRTGRFVFEGLTDLLPIYEELVDGAEILWSEQHRTVRKVRLLARRKEELSMFDDTPAIGNLPHDGPVATLKRS